MQREFPGISGFSPQNIWYMRAFYLALTEEVANLQQAVGDLDGKNLPQVVGEIPGDITYDCWLSSRIPLIAYGTQKDHRARLSRDILVHQIESGLCDRQGKAITTLKATLPPQQSDLARQAVKDPYIFDFLTLTADARERELEQGLLDHIQKFLIELGVGFAFVGRQVHLNVGDDDFYIDLLFYHLRLRCYIVIELKAGEFKPEYAGKMNFYLSAVDEQLRHPDDKPTIGLILCKTKKRLTAEYALRDIRKPIGIADWQTKLVESLPKNLKGSLPTIEERKR